MDPMFFLCWDPLNWTYKIMAGQPPRNSRPYDEGLLTIGSLNKAGY